MDDSLLRKGCRRIGFPIVVNIHLEPPTKPSLNEISICHIPLCAARLTPACPVTADGQPRSARPANGAG